MVDPSIPASRFTLVGRDRERRRLRDTLSAALDGNGSLVLVSGEAGIGKTTLVAGLVQEARRLGALVLQGGCYDLTTTPPYGPWSEAIRGYRPANGQVAVPSWFDNSDELLEIGSQIALFEEARTFFASIASEQPVVLVLEDLHWSDSASLEALRYLARTLHEVAILLVMTYRDDEITRRHELYQLLPLLIRESRAERVHLNRLDSEAVRELVASRYDLPEVDVMRLVEHLLQRSEGNPFFAGEILLGLEDEQALLPGAGGWTLGNLDQVRVPSLLRQVLDARLARLSSETRQALQAAAGIGQHVRLSVWRTVSSLSEAELDRVIAEALDARVLEDTADGAAFQFRHALLREALYESLILNRRRALHRQIGETLAESANPDPDAVAHHFQQANDPRAAGWLIRAGVRAEGSYAWSSAARSYEATQAILEADPATAQVRGWLLFQTGHLLRYADHERSLAHFEEVERVAGVASDPLLAACSHFFHGLVRCFCGELGAGVAEMRHAVGIVDRLSPQDHERARQAISSLFPAEIFSHPRVTSGSFLAQIGVLPGVNILARTYVIWLASSGRFHEAMKLGESVVDSVNAVTDNEPLIQDCCRDAYYGLAVAADTLGRPEVARRWRAQAIAAYERVGHHSQVGGSHRDELIHLLTYSTDRVAERRRVARAAVEAAERAGGAWHHPSRAHGLPLDLLEGRWDDARDVALQTLEYHQPTAWIIRFMVFGVLARERVDPRFTDLIWADTQAFLREGLATEPGDREYFIATAAQHINAELSLDAGDLDRARAWIEMHDRWLGWSGAVLRQAEGQLLWARYHRLAGDLTLARQHAGQALEHATDPRQPLALVAAHRCLGMLDTDEGRFDDAAVHLQASLDLAEACAAPFEQAQTMLALAELALKSGNSAGARSLLREARRICEPLDAKRALSRAANIEAGLHQPRTRYPAGLSEREVEVLRLVMEGMSNPEVGETLFISPRTVSQHLRSVYNKLGVNSRAAAAARWAEVSRE